MNLIEWRWKGWLVALAWLISLWVKGGTGCRTAPQRKRPAQASKATHKLFYFLLFNWFAFLSALHFTCRGDGCGEWKERAEEKGPLPLTSFLFLINNWNWLVVRSALGLLVVCSSSSLSLCAALLLFHSLIERRRESKLREKKEGNQPTPITNQQREGTQPSLFVWCCVG